MSKLYIIYYINLKVYLNIYKIYMSMKRGKIMKKLLSMLLIGLMSISIFGCSFIKPEDKATEFLNAVKTKNEDVLIGYTNNKYVNLLLHSTGDKNTLDEIYKNLFKNLSFKITSVTENKTGAVVKVDITNVNFKKVFDNYEDKSYDYMILNLYSGKLNKKKLNKKCLDILAKEISSASKSKKKVTKSVKINLTKNENYSYDLNIDTKLMDALIGGLISGYQ